MPIQAFTKLYHTQGHVIVNKAVTPDDEVFIFNSGVSARDTMYGQEICIDLIYCHQQLVDRCKSVTWVMPETYGNIYGMLDNVYLVSVIANTDQEIPVSDRIIIYPFKDGRVWNQERCYYAQCG